MRNVAEKRTKYTMECEAERYYKHNKLSLQEYCEIINDIHKMYEDKTLYVYTICLKVKEFIQLYGINIQEDGIGWKMRWY